ncbi:TRAP transporter small permease [Puniceibacterium sp. IMCC21224]|uniref:TRAP transporter small permease n=1 Tax=Puniceibacterium sp. IMCC21224 TaxID=1618204 RepID=UPI00064DC878|nr:TRAP transporter small permease [Puniceibacterium sp. IMCC21224]KMK66166.1 TRAP-type C4-dicarboxylate transport system, small permease component [Puniceibacterium sp. IMCC21224]
MLKTLDMWAGRLTGLAALIGTVGLIAEVVVILVDVVGRYYGSPLRGAQDISTMAMVLLVFGGMALCDRRGGHIAVDLFEKSMPVWLRRTGDVLSALLGAAIFGGIAWTMLESAALSRMLNLATNIIQLPKVWFQYAVVFFSIVTALGMFLRAITLIFTDAPPPRPEDAH